MVEQHPNRVTQIHWWYCCVIALAKIRCEYDYCEN